MVEKPTKLASQSALAYKGSRLERGEREDGERLRSNSTTNYKLQLFKKLGDLLSFNFKLGQTGHK